MKENEEITEKIKKFKLHTLSSQFVKTVNIDEILIIFLFSNLVEFFKWKLIFFEMSILKLYSIYLFNSYIFNKCYSRYFFKN